MDAQAWLFEPDVSDGETREDMTRTRITAAGAPRPSMADVARLAGVSSQTVSRVSNGHSNVDEQTRARVVAAMQTLGYRPNGAARALKSGRFHTVGVIMTSLQTFGNIRTLDAIAQEAAKTDYSVTLLPISDPTLGRVSGAYQRLSAQAVAMRVGMGSAESLRHHFRRRVGTTPGQYRRRFSQRA